MTISQMRKRNERRRARSAKRSDGQTEGYWARRNGKTVFIAPYKTPETQ